MQATNSSHLYPSGIEGIYPQGGVRRRRLTWFVMLALGISPASVFAAVASPALDPTPPATLEFSSAFTGSSQSIDVSRFEKGNPVLPGSYNVDVFVNEGRVARENIQFRSVDGSSVAQPCFDYTTIAQMGVDMGRLDPQIVNVKNSCITIHDISADAAVQMDVGALRLDVSIPQESLKRQARGYVSPELWDQGETAFLLGYNFNAYSLDQSYAGQRTAGGIAVAVNGSQVQVQSAQYYTPGAGGNYVPSTAGNYLLGTNGQYVEVQRGSFAPVGRAGFSSNDMDAYLGLDHPRFPGRFK